MKHLPQPFIERLAKIVPKDTLDTVRSSFGPRNLFSLRINTLKADPKEVIASLSDHKINYQPFKMIDNVFMVDSSQREIVRELDVVKEGKIYFQSLSSLFVAKTLDSKKEQLILDMCAAPGSKTTQLAAMMNNCGRIIAIEKVKPRYYKLKAVLELLGVRNVETKCMDARAFRPKDIRFDKVLIDAPCSSEGRFALADPKSYRYWSLRKIKEMKRKQKGLLLRGCELLRTGGTLVYSTCTYAPEENEEVVDWLLRKTDGSVEVTAIDHDGVLAYAPLLRWKEKKYDESISRCLRIAPDEIWDGFFVAKLKKLK